MHATLWRSVLALTKLSLAKKVVMACVYSLTVPIGVAVGIAVSRSYDLESKAALAVQVGSACLWPLLHCLGG